jgi:hypothetical protein
MNDRELAELLRYSSPREIYIVTWDNRLVLLICPFEVLVLQNIGILRKSQIVHVDEVKVTKELVTVFVILGNAYYYHHFDFRL